jgi:hypothetical protein
LIISAIVIAITRFFPIKVIVFETVVVSVIVFGVPTIQGQTELKTTIFDHQCRFESTLRVTVIHELNKAVRSGTTIFGFGRDFAATDLTDIFLQDGCDFNSGDVRTETGDVEDLGCHCIVLSLVKNVGLVVEWRGNQGYTDGTISTKRSIIHKD